MPRVLQQQITAFGVTGRGVRPPGFWPTPGSARWSCCSASPLDVDWAGSSWSPSAIWRCSSRCASSTAVRASARPPGICCRRSRCSHCSAASTSRTAGAGPAHRAWARGCSRRQVVADQQRPPRHRRGRATKFLVATEPAARVDLLAGRRRRRHRCRAGCGSPISAAERVGRADRRRTRTIPRCRPGRVVRRATAGRPTSPVRESAGSAAAPSAGRPASSSSCACRRSSSGRSAGCRRGREPPRGRDAVDRGRPQRRRCATAVGALTAGEEHLRSAEPRGRAWWGCERPSCPRRGSGPPTPSACSGRGGRSPPTAVGCSHSPRSSQRRTTD